MAIEPIITRPARQRRRFALAGAAAAAAGRHASAEPRARATNAPPDGRQLGPS